MLSTRTSQRDQALLLLQSRGMVRLREFVGRGITAATVSRMERDGAVVRLARGLYQLPDADLDEQHALAEVAKLIPKGVVCLTSALAFHGLTDQLPARTWVALGRKDWRPSTTSPPVRIVRFPDHLLSDGVEHHVVENVSVPVFNVARTVIDLFRYRRVVGETIAIEGLREALRQRRASSAEIARLAKQVRVWDAMRPYLMALGTDA
ncbi:type IV toxin-antitoxin system AbiEi family antitoxin domain-containing protein [Luteimonas sp. RC10]|uniref:type IV toxin-antitoxin system AbiEi family antitoxin domain-containing protein n=1 Tax=Luteimonas sp. RC10 TaxID=2587035 RepID=UPI00161DF9EC|nr:type IV toxin-antitoxin system AbiEi family antitoxin domain-containing protein [Luteimonas sp. RC10]MBB3343176.1 putative transcriptional regulator of viral defense system [Luteimonas sp. RC10]